MTTRDKQFIQWQGQDFPVVTDDIIRSIKYAKHIELIDNPQLISYLETRFPDSDSLWESWSRIKFNVEEKPKCPYCGKPVVWIGKKTKLYTKYCCVTCRARSEETTKRREETHLRKWGYKSCFLSPEYKAKLKEKTGYESANQMPDKIQRRHETMVAHYGTDKLSEIPEIIEKTKDTNLKKFGVEYPNLKPLEKKATLDLKQYIIDCGNHSFMLRLKHNRRLRNQVLDATMFLKGDADFPERVYCILNDIKEQPVCRWCGNPLQFRNISAGYFPTCDNPECKQKAVAVGEINQNYKTIDRKLKDSESDTKKSVYTRSERCWDALMDKLTEMGFVYKNNYDEVFTLECMNCGTIFEKTRNDINLRYNARRWGMCPKCQIKDSTYRSSFEKDVCAVLNEIVGADIKIFTNKYINNYEVDINIPDLKIAVECNGLYWHSELCKDKDYHIQKKLAVESTGYLLVYIWKTSGTIIKKQLLKIFGKYVQVKK